MKNINNYILEQEYKKIDEEWDKYFDSTDTIYESYSSFGHKTSSFWGWLKRLGKKFWNWLTNKDFTDENIDWSCKKGIKCVETSSDHMTDLVNKKGFLDIFPDTKQFKKKYPNATCIQGLNKSKVPAIIMTIITDKKTINNILNKCYNSKQLSNYQSKMDLTNNICLVVCIEINKQNNDDTEYIFDKHISKMFKNCIIDRYDMIFFHKSFVSSYIFKFLKNEFDEFDNSSLPVIITADLNDKNTTNKTDLEKTEEPTKDLPKNTPETSASNNGSENNEEESKNEFELRKIKFKFMDNAEKIKEFISDNKLDNDYKYIVINKIEFVEKPDNMSKLFEKILTSKDFKNEINKISTEEENKEIKVCFSLDKTSNNNKEIINVLSNLSIEIDGTIIWEVEDTKNGLFVYSLNENIFESLDVDNLFWMLDTWFTNNEQERTTFMSLIDNCIIKKTYNKNDLAKLCDNINFDVRPFINFISKDVVIKDNEKEDLNFDYYYELKKIIDALISNKATNNKYVRFS